MGRPVVLSNGQLFVGLDERGLVHDFYYPYVGLENLTNARSTQHKIGVWVAGVGGNTDTFSWTDDGSWQTDIKYHEESPVSDIRMHSDKLGVTLQLLDFVDSEYNAFVRSVHVTNNSDAVREVRLFMHQVFRISRDGRADTAMYVPEDHYILDYKGRCCLVIAGKTSGNDDFDQYAVGNYAIEGKAGTFKDAEDGALSGNPVEHGGVDSVLRFSHTVAAHDSFTVDYWIAAADSETDAQIIHRELKQHSVAQRRNKTQQAWATWASPSEQTLKEFEPADKTSIKQSLLVVKAHCDDRGSILASGDSSIFNSGRDYYCYCWPRDASYAIWPLIRLGLFDEARHFLEFARDTRHPDGYLMHKYQPDRSIGSTWHPLVHGAADSGRRRRELAIQEDETALTVYMVGEYFKYSQDKAFMLSLLDTFVTPAADFMTRFIDEATGLPHASYDLWEERFLTSTYTVSTVIAALETAVRLAEVADHADDALRWRHAAEGIRSNLPKLYKQDDNGDGYFRKGFLLQPDESLAYDDTLDISSLYGPYMFAGLPHDDPMISSTLKHVEEKLLNNSPIGGVIRYEHDNYFLAKRDYKGNPWIVCTLWLAQLYISLGRREDAQKLIEWSKGRAINSGALSEQFDPENGQAIGVTPLVWSHAEMINTLLDTKED